MTNRPTHLSPDTQSLFVGLAAVTRMIRARDRLSQADVARRAGLSANFVGAVEHGRANPNVTHLGQLAHGLGLAGARELLSRAEDAARRIGDGTISTP